MKFCMFWMFLIVDVCGVFMMMIIDLMIYRK